ncbi:APC family permease [Pasteuria penetrans]|uniref:APC family permease n=1 Tax=Pasteuria penetrans TaxID=86005 RepID=UPI001FE82EA8|nr:APC family permease [Pasteuria penetrans]
MGWKSGLVAGAALQIDYILTCAVSVTSGTDAIIAALQPYFDLQPCRVPIASFFILFVMVLNLRGLRESGTIFAFPTYFFVTAMVVMVGSGFWQAMGDGEGVLPVPAPPDPHSTGVIWFLLLRAFASGCSALTGIEAVANATSTFHPPQSKRAARTLAILGLLLGSLLLGISLLVFSYRIIPESGGETTLLSQLNERIFGRGVVYYSIQAATALILILAANTAFSSFPVLSGIMAKDGFMPRIFALRGDRLNFSNGIIVLALAAIALVVLFRGDLHKLVPLYSIGVFLSFTLSQMGMVKRWYSLRPRGWLPRCFLNALGGIVTFVVLSICAITKFDQGAWLVLIFLPLLTLAFYRVRCHYDDVAEQLRLGPGEDAINPDEHLIIIPVSGINRVVRNTIAYVRSLSGQLVAVHISFDEEKGRELEKEWQNQYSDIRLVVIHSRYRSMINPLLRFVDHVSQSGGRNEGRKRKRRITVLVAEFIPVKWWHRILHNQSALLLRFFLLRYKDVVITTVPFRLKR